MLNGGARCEGADALITLGGESANGERVSAAFRLRGDGTGEWRVGVTNVGEEGQAALTASGFHLDAQTGEMARGEALTWFPL